MYHNFIMLYCYYFVSSALDCVSTKNNNSWSISLNKQNVHVVIRNSMISSFDGFSDDEALFLSQVLAKDNNIQLQILLDLADNKRLRFFAYLYQDYHLPLSVQPILVYVFQ